MVMISLVIVVATLGAQTITLNMPKVKINDNTEILPSAYYIGQTLKFDVTSASAGYTWNLHFKLDTDKNTLDSKNLNQIGREQSAINEGVIWNTQSNSKTYYCRFVAYLFNSENVIIAESSSPIITFTKPQLFSNINMTPFNPVKKAERVTFTCTYTPIPGIPLNEFNVYYATTTNSTDNPTGLANWKILRTIPLNNSNAIQTVSFVMVDCKNEMDLMNKYFGLRIAGSLFVTTYSQNLGKVQGSIQTHPPTITDCNATLIGSNIARVSYTINDPDNDLESFDVKAKGELYLPTIQKYSDHAIIESCRNDELEITVTAVDGQCKSTSEVRNIKLSSKRTNDGYEWVGNYNRDAMVNTRFPDMKVYLDIIEKPYKMINGNKIELTNEETRNGVRLGLYLWASILPDINIRFVNSSAEADMTIKIMQAVFEGRHVAGYSEYWSGEEPTRIVIDPDNVAFRDMDFISPKMAYERVKAINDAEKEHWGYHNNIDESDVHNKADICKKYTEAKEYIETVLNADPENVCLKGECINWDLIPYTNIFGAKCGDLVWVAQHEFGHTLGLEHIDQESEEQKLSCAPISCKPDQRFGNRQPVTSGTEGLWIPRAGFRENKLSSIRETNSHSCMIGNTFEGIGGNSRAIFDIDADALSTGPADKCRCQGIENPLFRGYNVTYPEIRNGWRIVLQHKTTKIKYYTSNWHTAHDMMGWVKNNNTKALDANWFVIDILDKNDVKAMGPLVSLEINQLGTGSYLQAEPRNGGTQIYLKGQSTIGLTIDNIVYASQKIRGGFQMDVRLDTASIRGGLMIRQSLATNAPMIYVCNYNSSSVSIYSRAIQGESGTWSSTQSSSLPVYLRIQRFGKTVKVYKSSDGTTYTQMAEMPFFTGEIYAGLCADGGSNAYATFSNYTIRGYDPLTPILKLLLD